MMAINKRIRCLKRINSERTGKWRSIGVLSSPPPRNSCVKGNFRASRPSPFGQEGKGNALLRYHTTSSQCDNSPAPARMLRNDGLDLCGASPQI